MWQYTSVGKLRQEDYKSAKVSLGYIVRCVSINERGGEKVRRRERKKKKEKQTHYCVWSRLPAYTAQLGSLWPGVHRDVALLQCGGTSRGFREEIFPC